MGLTDPLLLAAVYHAYNEYIAEFNRSAPGRYFGLGCLPNDGVDAAVDELRHCAALGLMGATFVPWGSAMPVWHPMWEPMWAAAEDLDIVLTFHVFEGGAATVGRAVKETHPASAGAWTTVAPSETHIFFAIFTGNSAPLLGVMVKAGTGFDGSLSPSALAAETL